MRKDGEGWQVCYLPDIGKAAELWKAFWSDAGAPAYLAEMTLLRQCGQQLAGVLRGEVDPLHLIFSEGSLTTVEHLYQDSPAYRFYNQLVRQALATALERWPAGRTVRILEIGGEQVA